MKNPLKERVMRQVALTTAYQGSRQTTDRPDHYERIATNEYDEELLTRYYLSALEEARPWLRWCPSRDTLVDFLTERIVWRWLLTVNPEAAPSYEKRSETLLLQLKEQANRQRTRALRRPMHPF